MTAGTTYYYVVSAVTLRENSNSNESYATPSETHTQLKFDETTGAIAVDASGNNHSGTLVNGPLWATTGKIGGAVDLDGTDDYVSLPTGIVNGLTSYTISAWVNLDAVSTWMRIFDFGAGTTNYMFLSPKGGSNVVRFAITTSGNTAEQQINGTAALPTGVWTHVAVTLSGSVGKLYVNGSLVGQNTSMTLNPSSLGNTTNNYIGKSQWADPYLDGRIDDFRIYSRALTASEVNTLANTLVPAAPTDITATSGNGNVSLSWSSVSGATSYNVKRSLTAGGPYATVAGGITNTSYINTGLSNATTYYFVVSAVNVFSEGNNSSEVNATLNIYTWDGGSTVDNHWSTPENWVGDLAPQPGDHLVFPSGASRLENVNDYPTGTAFGSITVSGSGYKFSNTGNIIPASIEVQPGIELEADAIVAGVLTVGAGSTVTIAPIMTESLGTLSAGNTLTQIPVTAVSGAAFGTSTTKAAEIISTPTISSTDTEENMPAVNVASATVKTIAKAESIVTAIISSPLVKAPGSTVRLDSAAQNELPSYPKKFEKQRMTSATCPRQARLSALQSNLHWINDDVESNIADHTRIEKHAKQLTKAVDGVLAEEEESLMAVLYSRVLPAIIK